MSHIHMFNELTVGPGIRCSCHLWFCLMVRLSGLIIKFNELSKHQILQVSFVNI
jgi:hypothetical protein